MKDLTTALNNLIRSTSLTEVLVRAGPTVQQDEVLPHFDRDDLAAALRQSDAQLAAAQAQSQQAERSLSKSRALLGLLGDLMRRRGHFGQPPSSGRAGAA